MAQHKLFTLFKTYVNYIKVKDTNVGKIWHGVFEEVKRILDDNNICIDDDYIKEIINGKREMRLRVIKR